MHFCALGSIYFWHLRYTYLTAVASYLLYNYQPSYVKFIGLGVVKAVKAS